MTRPTPSPTSPGRRAQVVRTWVAVVSAGALALLWAAPASGALPIPAVTGSISGTVVGPGGPAVGVQVSAYGAATGTTVSAYPNAAGAYVLAGLPAGEYDVTFDGMATGLVSEYYDNRLRSQDADAVTVTAGANTAGIDAVLAPGGGIAGTVSGPSGPLQYVWVSALGAGNDYYDGIYTAADGTYQLVGLPAGSYQIRFAPMNSMVSEYYNDAVLWSDADLVPVTVGLTTPGIDATLVEGGSIAGVVRGPSGPLENAHVAAFDIEGGGNGHALTAADGSYVVEGLAPGTYQVTFEGPAGAGLRTEYYDNQVASMTAASLIIAGPQQHRTGIDAVLALATDPVFSDVPHAAPFHDAIEWLAFFGVTSGYPDGTFHPSAPVERQAMAAFLYRYAHEPEFTPPATPTFSDVPVSSPFYIEIEWLVDQGITTGWPDGTFRPNATVERQAMAAFLYRYALEPAFTDPATPSFSDVPATSPFFTEVEWLADAGVTTGWPDHTFRPTNTVERQAMAAFLMRFDAWLWE